MFCLFVRWVYKKNSSSLKKVPFFFLYSFTKWVCSNTFCTILSLNRPLSHPDGKGTQLRLQKRSKGSRSFTSTRGGQAEGPIQAPQVPASFTTNESHLHTLLPATCVRCLQQKHVQPPGQSLESETKGQFEVFTRGLCVSLCLLHPED